jgi:LDH2 family malate/lactate/ureidoglycolate dehydrogenase
VPGIRMVVPEPMLRQQGVALLRALGVPDADAALTVDVFLQADLRGEESHGMRLFLHILGRLRDGGAQPVAETTTLVNRGAIALLDAHDSLGQVVGVRGMELAIAKAREYGVGIVGIRQSNSYTSAKYYPLRAVQHDMIGLTYANSVPMMPPEGGRTPILGNNPVAIAAPAATEFPFVLDMACATAKEKIYQAQERQEPIPPLWALGPDGNPTTDPGVALASGVLLPFGGYKAFGLAAAHEILTSILTGGPLFNAPGGEFTPYDKPMNVCLFLQAINIEWFVPVDDFKRQVDALIHAIKASALRPGVARVYVPGERGFLEERRRIREGIPLPLRVVEELQRWAGELGVPPMAVGARVSTDGGQ